MFPDLRSITNWSVNFVIDRRPALLRNIYLMSLWFFIWCVIYIIHGDDKSYSKYKTIAKF